MFNSNARSYVFFFWICSRKRIEHLCLSCFENSRYICNDVGQLSCLGNPELVCVVPAYSCACVILNFNSFPNMPLTSNFSFSHNVFCPFGELSAILNKFEIVVCKLLSLGESKICCLRNG